MPSFRKILGAVSEKLPEQTDERTDGKGWFYYRTLRFSTWDQQANVRLSANEGYAPDFLPRRSIQIVLKPGVLKQVQSSRLTWEVV